MRNAVLFFTSALLLLAGGSAWLALYPTVPADLGGVESMDGRAAHVRIPVSDDDELDGWVVYGTRPGVVLLFAGYARDHRRMWRYGHFLHALGLSVVTVDFRSARTWSRKPTTLGYWELLDARATLAPIAAGRYATRRCSTASTGAGHRARAIFDRYDIVSGADLRDAVEKLARRSEG